MGNVANHARHRRPRTILAGGSEVYRINPDGSPRKVWSSPQDIVYAIGFDAGGLPAAGHRKSRQDLSAGFRHREHAAAGCFAHAGDRLWPRTQIGSKPGDLYAITGNIGKVFRIGPGFEKKGTFESPVLDAGAFAYWGRISYRGLGKITVSTRSGNRSHPESNWSPWATLQTDTSAAACDSCGAGRTVSPSARFLQYKIDLTPAAGQPEPEVSYVEVAYLPKNVAPAGGGHRYYAAQLSLSRRSCSSLTPSTSITLPPIGQQKSSASHVARRQRFSNCELCQRLRRRSLAGVG